MSPLGDRRHLRAVRHAAVPERMRASTGDNAYAVYVAILVLGLLTSPYYLVVTGLLSPDVRPLLLSDALPPLATAGAWLVLAAAVLGGRIAGPVHLPPLMAAILGSGPWRRSLALRRPYLRSAALLTLALLAIVIAPAIALTVAGRPWPDLVLVLLATVALGLVATGCWLAGQVLPRAWSGVLAAAFVVLAPWVPLPPLALGVAALLAGYAVPHLLERLPGPELSAQARRWDAAGVAAATGDLSAAVGHLRQPPRLGAHWSAIGRGSWLPGVFWRRDLIGSLRDPERFVLGCFGLVAAGALGALAGVAPGGTVWIVLVLSVIVAYLAVGVWADGYRHALEADAAPTLYGRGTAYLLGVHSLLPVTLLVALGGAGMVAVALTAGTTSLAVLLAALGLVVALAGRLHAAGKGPLPVEFLTPIPTPMGDLSGLIVGGWQVSSVLIAAVTVGVSGWFVLAGSPLWLVGYVAGAALLAYDAFGTRERS